MLSSTTLRGEAGVSGLRGSTTVLFCVGWGILSGILLIMLPRFTTSQNHKYPTGLD
jgi:hypothetical protein